jgi:Flp pilus assembly protein TadB
MQPDDLVTRSRVEEYVLALARIDQGRLWDVADRVKERERRLAETAQAAGSDAEDAVMFEEIERRHRAFELAQEAHERVRYLSFLIGAGAALVGVCVSVLYGFWLAVPFLMLAIAATVASIVFWQRVERARRDEEAALARPAPAPTSRSRSIGSTDCSPATRPVGR